MPTVDFRFLRNLIMQRATWSKLASKRTTSKSRTNWLGLSSQRIDYGVHGSSRALYRAMCDILGCVRSALRHIGCRVDGSRLNGANGDSDPENDRKERFHSNKVSFLTPRMRLSHGHRDAAESF
jgi:hypothetical protein